MNIARLPNYTPSDEYCSNCDDDNIVIVIKGKTSGNQINLCSKCYHKMQDEINTALNNIKRV